MKQSTSVFCIQVSQEAKGCLLGSGDSPLRMLHTMPSTQDRGPDMTFLSVTWFLFAAKSHLYFLMIIRYFSSSMSLHCDDY